MEEESVCYQTPMEYQTTVAFLEPDQEIDLNYQ